MASSDTAFVGRVPALYDRHLGPIFFAPYATDIGARVARLEPASVLEIACGTGIATQALARVLPSSVGIVATDLRREMIDHAMTKPGLERVRWQQADALALPFPDATFDAVVCQFGAMFFPDRPAGYVEARRVLAAGGHFVFSVWGSIAHNPIDQVIEQALVERFPADPPRFLSRTPHGYHDVGAIRADLAAAGFAQVEVETVTLECRAPSPRDPAVGFCYGSPLHAELVAREPGDLETTTQAIIDALTRCFGAGPISAPMQAHIVVAFG